MSTTPLVLLALVAAQPPKVPLDIYGRPDYKAAMNDRLAKGITPDRNANVLLWKAFGPSPEGGAGMLPEYFERLGIPEPPKDGDYFIDLTRFARDQLKLDPEAVQKFHEPAIAAGRKPWKAAEFPHVAAWLAANEKPLAVVTEATRRPLYFNPLVTKKSDTEYASLTDALMPSVQKCRELAVALCARAMFRTGEGNAGDAWADLLTCHRLGRLIARGCALEGIIGIAVDHIASNATLAFIAHAGLTTDQLRDRLKEFQSLSAMPTVADRLDLSERYVHLDGIERLRNDGGLAKIDDMMTADERRALDWSHAVASGNKWYDRMVAAMRKPTRAERRAAFDPIVSELDALVVKKPGKVAELIGVKPSGKDVVDFHGNLMVALNTTLIGRCADANDRAEQIQRNVVVAFALAAYHRSEGRYPATLDVLAPRFLPAVPGDVFSGRALVYRRDGAGYLVYSVGPDGKDDAGRGHDADPPGDDLSVRVPPK